MFGQRQAKGEGEGKENEAKLSIDLIGSLQGHFELPAYYNKGGLPAWLLIGLLVMAREWQLLFPFKLCRALNYLI